MAEGYGAPKRTKPPKLTIEDYLHFLHTGNRLDLTVDHLNQIIDMHGFKKLHKTHKSILLEIVSKMELMNPTRSTIQDDGVTSDAFLALDDVIKDLNDLKWQECCVTSLQTLNTATYHHQCHQHESLASGCSAGTIVSVSSEKQPRRPRRKLRKLAQIGAGGVEKEVVSPMLNLGSSETPPTTPALENWSPRKKRTVKYINVIGSGVGVASPVAAGLVASLDA